MGETGAPPPPLRGRGLNYSGVMGDPTSDLDLLLQHAAYTDEEIPECFWPSASQLKTMAVADLPEDAILSVQLAGAFGDLPGDGVEARLYGSRESLKVLVTHEPPTSDGLPDHLTPSGYLRLLANQVAVAPSGRARVSYLDAEANYPGWLAEYAIDVEGRTLYDLGSQGHGIAHGIESSLGDKLAHLNDVFKGLAASGRLVTIADLERVDRATTIREKGVALEDLIADLFVSLGGLRLDPRHGRNRRTGNAEIDHVFQTLGHPTWARDSPLVLTECKNWSGAVERCTLDGLETKIRDRSGQCKVAVFISWAGFSRGFNNQLIRASREQYLILTMDGEGLRQSIERGDFRAYFDARYQEAIGR